MLVIADRADLEISLPPTAPVVAVGAVTVWSPSMTR